MGIKHMKTYLTSLAVKDMQIKRATGHTYTLPRMGKLKRLAVPGASPRSIKWYTHHG